MTKGGAAVQHREVQGGESNEFFSYFKNGIRYEAGGHDSGFNTAKIDTSVVMYHVKGKKRTRVLPVC